MIQLELHYLIAAKVEGIAMLEPQAGSDQGEKPRVDVPSR